MPDRVERILSLVLTAAAVVIAVAIAFREFGPRRFISNGSAVALSMDSVADWREMLPIGIREGPSGAPVILVEFADLECPACRSFQPAMDSVMERYSPRIATYFVNFPLAQHRFALGAARAGICAARLGKFAQWRTAIFNGQDSLGLKSWGSFAVAAGIKDTVALADCATNPAPVANITAGLEFGSRIGLVGTPTVIVNGWRFSNTPSTAELMSAIEAELAGRRPAFALPPGHHP